MQTVIETGRPFAEVSARPELSTNRACGAAADQRTGWVMVGTSVGDHRTVAVGIPLTSTARTLRLTDTPTGLALAHTTISFPLSIWLLTSFFESIPTELDEAAQVDGCSRLGALIRVVVPVASGGVAGAAIFAFLASWNEFLFAADVAAFADGSRRHRELPDAVRAAVGSMTTLAAVYSIPVVILTLGPQRRIVAGLTLGAVKG